MNNNNFDNININSNYTSTISKEGFFDNWTNRDTWGQDVYFRTMEIAGKEIKVGLIVPKGVDINLIDQIFTEKQGEIAKAIYAFKFDKQGNIKDKDIGVIKLLPNGSVRKKGKNGISVYTADQINAKIGTRLLYSSEGPRQPQAHQPKKPKHANQHPSAHQPQGRKKATVSNFDPDDDRRVVEVDENGREII
jgi:hypothetical protein